jgi:hypothetical protein
MGTRIQYLVAGACTAAILSIPAFAADVKLDAKQSASVTPTSVDSPSIGYVINSKKLELRAILGVPGAARFSDPLPLPAGTRSAEMASGQAWVLLFRATDMAAYQPASQTAMALPSSGIPTAWAFSPSGSRLALFNRVLGTMTTFSGLPASPTLESTLQITQPDQFAISDNGSLVYVSGGQVYTGAGHSVYQSSALGPVAFEATRDLLVLFDSATGSLVEIDPSNPSPRSIANGFGTPDLLFAASDRIYAGNTSGATVWTLDYSAGLVATQNVSVTRIVPSGIAGTVLVSYTALGPAWLVNAQGVSFVPSALTPAAQ